MDPATAISTAAAVIDLVIFGYKVIACAVELRSSAQGALEENIDRETIARDIQYVLGNLHGSNEADGDRELEDLRQRALKVATELSIELNKLKVTPNGSKQEALKKALRSLWKRKDILNLEDRLRGLSQEINLHLTTDANKLLNEMTEAQRSQVTKILDEIEQQSKELRAQLIDQQAKNREETHLLRQSVDAVKEETASIRESLDKVVDGSQGTKIILEQILEAGADLQDRFKRVEELLAQPEPNQSELTTGAVNQVFEALAWYCNRKTAADVLLQQKSDETASAFPVTGHVYTASVQVRGRGKLVQGNIGPAQKHDAKHTFGGSMNVTDDAKVVSGNISELGFAASFLS
ncbi:hypothetical protein PV08_08120 [Exophiala spinifera]|uniref:Fungal N-terminal domain-containing protein n=1 Tax=Exophiala spinifera TaxID=91928 RepID=A0A0D2B208_9EURO|nr:uncharacterized protein PV08_08120 [Exophiala spinifera]KIW12933.1 hypothetical protein PV08_08120 [Exophiala spinifera]